MEHVTEALMDEIEGQTSSILSTDGSTTIFTPSLQMILSGRIWVPEDLFQKGA